MTDRKTLLILAAMLLCSCGKRAADKNAAAPADTAAVAMTQTETPPSPLPDTVYESASRLRHITRVIDTVTPGTVTPGDLYDQAPGVMTFRANSRRDADMGGRVSGNPDSIALVWKFITETDRRETSHGTWGGGTGWTGQPLYVEWPDSLIDFFATQGFTPEGFSGREIIVGSLASAVYFIDFETGRKSREPIAVPNPVKGTVALDPSLNGNLYVGSGVQADSLFFGALTLSLRTHEITQRLNRDHRALRGWHAFDSSPVRVGDFIFRPGENGIIYKYRVLHGQPGLHSTMTYTVNGVAPGIESSMAVWANYGFTADNHGYIVATNLNNMTPVWSYHTGDDSDATPVLTVEDGRPCLYVASEIDRQGEGTACLAKLDAANGIVIWEQRFPGRRYDSEDGKHFDGGFYATPLPGTGDCADLLFANFVENLDGQNGRFLAIDRKTGRTVYSIPLKSYAWSSPVGFLNENGRMFVFTADCIGNVYLINGRDGRIICRRNIGSNFESSPVVIGNSVVVGSRGNTIYRLSIL